MIQDIKLRIATNPPLVTLGRKFTYLELDENFIEIFNALASLNNSANIAPYSGGTTYTGLQYVSYGGNIYQHVSPTPSIGVIPNTNPAVWQLTSVGVLAHAQNTDSFLAQFTASQVSAAELRSFLDEQVISLSAFNSAITGSELIAGRRYYIIDLKLHVKAIASNAISSYAEYDVFVPINNGSIGAFDEATAYAVNDLVMYNYLVYKSKTIHTNNLLPPDDAVNWDVQVSSNPLYYQLNTNSCTVLWDKSTGVIQINKKIDANGNEHYQTNELFQESQNILDQLSLILITGHGAGLRTGNKLIQSLINVGRKVTGSIQNNILENSIFSVEDSDYSGQFTSNKLYNVELNLDTVGRVADQIIESNIFSFATRKTLAIRAGAYLYGYTITDETSNAVDQLVGGDAVDADKTLFLDINGVNDAYGVYEIIDDDVNIDSIKLSTWPQAFRTIIVKPAIGRQILIETTGVVDGFGDGAITDEAFRGSYSLIGDRGDYIVFEKRSADGSDVVLGRPVFIQ